MRPGGWRPGPRLRAAAPFLAAVAAGALAHLPALFNGFVWDDYVFVLQNPVLQDLRNVPALFAKPETWGTAYANPYYRPLTMLSFLVDRQLWGGAAAGYHATNLLLHLAACALLLAALRRLLAPGPALAGALLFAVHPAAAEPVAYVSARADLLCALLVLASFLAWMRHGETGGRAPLALSALAYGAALLTKIAAGLFPAVFAVHGLLFFRRRPRARELAPFAAVALAYLAARAAVLEMETWPAAPLQVRLATAGPLIVRYAVMTLSPAQLGVFHDLAPRAALDAVALQAWALLAAGVVAAALAARRAPRAALALAWFLAGVLPVCGLVTLLQPTVAADRYLYLPLAGVALAAGAGVQHLAALRLPATGRRLAVGSAALALLVLGGATSQRVRIWRDSLTLWERAALEAPARPYVLDNLGWAYKEAGRWEESRRALEESLAIEEANPTAHLYLASLAFAVERPEVAEAERHTRRALELDPRSGQAHRFMSVAMLLKGDRAQALREAEAALELDPFDASARELAHTLAGGAPAPAAGD